MVYSLTQSAGGAKTKNKKGKDQGPPAGKSKQPQHNQGSQQSQGSQSSRPKSAIQGKGQHAASGSLVAGTAGEDGKPDEPTGMSSVIGFSTISVAQ